MKPGWCFGGGGKVGVGTAILGKRKV